MKVDRPLAHDIIGDLDVGHTAMLEVCGNDIVSVDVAKMMSASLLVRCGKRHTVLHVVGHQPHLGGQSNGRHRLPSRYQSQYSPCFCASWLD